MVHNSRIPMAYLALVGAMACPMLTTGAREHAPLKAAAFALETSFVLGDLKIEGNVHDRDGARDRVSKAWKDRKYDDAKALADAVAAGVRQIFRNGDISWFRFMNLHHSRLAGRAINSA